MAWLLWMGAGIVVAMLALVLYIVVMNWFDDRALARRNAVRGHQVDAERRMQASVQQTIQQMFDAVRDYR